MRHPIAFFLVAVAAGCVRTPGSDIPQPTATSTPTPQSMPPVMTAFAAGVYLADDPWRFNAGQPINTFNFAHLDDLYVRVTVPAMQGMSTLHLQFNNPHG